MSSSAPGQDHEREDAQKTPSAQENVSQTPTQRLSRFKEKITDPFNTKRESQPESQPAPIQHNIGTENHEKPQNPLSEDHGPPDGGIRAWSVVLGRFLNFWTGFGISNSYGTFQAYYLRHFAGYSTAAIALIGSSQSGLLFLGGVFVGPLFDRLGARRVLIPGAILYITAFMIAGFHDNFTLILVSHGFILGLANSLLFYPTTSCISTWFDKRRGVALGIAASGSSAGGIFWPILVNKVIYNYGLLWAYRCIALVSTPLLASACLLIKERRGPDGNVLRLNEKGTRQSILQPQFLALTGSLFFVYLGFGVPFGFIPMYAMFNDYSFRTGNFLLSLCYLGSFFGRTAAGLLADRFGRFNICSTMAIITGTLTICWIAMRTFAGLATFSILFGFFSGGLMPLGSACVAQITPNMGHIGLRIGVMMAFCSIGAFIGGPICGGLIDTSRKEAMGFIGANLFSGITTIFGGLLLFSTRCGWGGRGPGKWLV